MPLPCEVLSGDFGGYVGAERGKEATRFCDRLYDRKEAQPDHVYTRVHLRLRRFLV